MCCFTEDVKIVADTQIFARALDGRQLLVYSMSYAAEAPLAMVLPLPVVPGSGEDALRFVSLEDCPDFFDHLAEGFATDTGDLGTLSAGSMSEVGAATLEVKTVGAYEASYVPRPADFGRLDERFRLPPDIWLRLNTYRDYGFAVFKLKETRLAHVHPMAFDFPRRHEDRLFFPTFHIHRRTIESEAVYDHMLYCQPEPAMHWHLDGWIDSDEPAKQFVRCPRAAELVDLDFPCWRVEIKGRGPNQDFWVGPGHRVAQRRQLEIA